MCPIADIASAQRMGAALTYARRYALFTLVGIAGEDDLDAPDLDATSKIGGGEPPRSDHRSQSTADAGIETWARDGAKLRVRSGALVLTPTQSAMVRERLLAQLVATNSTDEAAAWARRNLSTKNRLTADDARIVEAKFQAKLSTIGDGEGASEARNAVSVQKCPSVGLMRPLAENFRRGLVTLLRRAQSASWAKRFACAIRSTGSSCPSRRALYDRTPSDPHHLTFMQPRALGHRVSDEFTVPVCRVHHRELHRQGDEAAWWGKIHIDPLPVALRLWQHTRLNGDELAPTSEGITPSHAAQKLDISVQDRAGTNADARADVEGAVSKDADPLASG